ncbi:MAG: hypothetical protein GY906_33425 [bacterium]|nr:hypothetical protein [bacterium]
MKALTSRRLGRICLGFSTAVLIGATSGPEDFPVLKGPYLGQKPPGLTPEVFAPGIISTDASEGASSFAHDHSFYLFARARSDENGILITEQQNGSWSQPRLAAFSAGKYDWDFMLAPDGETVFVASGRPTDPQDAPLQNYRIWVSRRIDHDWSAPRLLPPPVNTGQHDSYPSVTADGALYFFSRRDGGLGLGDIYRSRAVGGNYTEVENLGEAINTPYHEVDPYIAPDESYLIFCSDRPGGYGNDDFYISFRNADGSWTEPQNMGPKFNTPHHEYIPNVTPDGKYFFFTSNPNGDRNIYWVDARVIDEFRPKRMDQ